MALDATKIMVGAGVFSIGDWVTAGGPGTLVDVGHIKSPFELAASFDNFDIETERLQGILDHRPTKTDYTLKVAFHQAEVEWLRIALAQPATNKSGTGANLTLLVGERANLDHQATLVTAGPGTTGVRTLTFWRLKLMSVEAIQVGKGVEQLYIATFRVKHDPTLSTADKNWKQVDA
jgi:hypothetical protein